MVERNLLVTMQSSSPDFGIKNRQQTPPKRRNLMKMVQDDDKIQPGSPLKELDLKLSPFRD